MAEQENVEFVKALAKLKKELPWIGKTDEGFNYKYAPHSEYHEKWDPIIEKNGFVRRQTIESGENGEWDKVITKITHIETGLSEVSSITLPVTSDYQLYGAGRTYFHRYTLSCFGKEPVGEDHDGLREKPTSGSGRKRRQVGAKKNGAGKQRPVEESGKTKEHAVVTATRELVVATAETVEDLDKAWRANSKEYDKLGKDVYEKVVALYADRKKQLKKEGNGNDGK